VPCREEVREDFARRVASTVCPKKKYPYNNRIISIEGTFFWDTLYIRENFRYKLIHDCKISNPEEIESLFVEILNPNGKNVIVGSVYRPPNQNLVSFINEFNKILSIITKDNKQCYVMGDFNLDFFIMITMYLHKNLWILCFRTCLSHSLIGPPD
jgi:hypothetical protein